MGDSDVSDDRLSDLSSQAGRAEVAAALAQEDAYLARVAWSSWLE
ncbi:MAG: hypothetical protein OXI46_01575 [Gemmatimonadota bacterium]|nr:hypothetical protein [Gemmatimonadota bacterium]